MIDWVDIENGESGLSVRDKLNNLGRSAATLGSSSTLLFAAKDVPVDILDVQEIPKVAEFGSFILDRIVFCGCSASPGNCTVGIYWNAEKTAPAIVGTAQSLGSLTPEGRWVQAAMNITSQLIKDQDAIYLAMNTVGATGVTVDHVLVFGTVLDQG